ncbi:iron ABC transporter permease [Phaeobacter sp. B1627]|uniref:FecCD family ABC transporter permease n=1 Tax=Phaeobacter sp. B1627 TaxID=2583809 RepID=UPI00111AE2E2|nr:iron ABC transporter permease [Phaeobacter sp. B1627]TNJ45123.1 iron ABC transporter permease [Phaeobacter sp. B1627]
MTRPASVPKGLSDNSADVPPALRRRGHYWPALTGPLLALALIAVMALSLGFGARDVGWSDISGGLQGLNDTLGQAVVQMRIPRTVLAVLAGAALGMSGAVMQGVTRNPLADPGILGVNAGAAMAVVIAVAWFDMQSLNGFLWVASFGAAGAACFVYGVGSLGRGGATPLKLALAGAATSVALGSLSAAIILPRADVAGGIQVWQIGGVGGATFDAIRPMLPFLGAGFVVSLLSARSLNMLALGDEAAAAMGERVQVARVMAALGAVLLCGAATAICGPIGFVGLVVPHACRLMAGVDHRMLLPLSALGGAVLLTLADVAGRLVARPAELEAGVITAFVGAPVFIAIVRRKRIRDL